MILHSLGKIPDGYTYDGKYTALSAEEITESNCNVDEVWYWYACESYEGSGDMIVRMKNSFYFFEISHCSCNGPLDKLNEIDKKKSFSLDDIQKMKQDHSQEYTDEAWLAVSPLIDMVLNSVYAKKMEKDYSIRPNRFETLEI